MNRESMETNHRGVAWRLLGAGVMALLLLLAGCANTDFHFFSFNTAESPGIEVLDYQYGESRQPMTRPRESERRSEKVDQAVRMGGDILRPDKLYVKWRIRATGTAYEQTVNLDQLLPRDIEEHEVHFTIDGSRLYVYLISPKWIKPGETGGPGRYRSQKTTTLWSGIGQRVS